MVKITHDINSNEKKNILGYTEFIFSLTADVKENGLASIMKSVSLNS